MKQRNIDGIKALFGMAIVLFALLVIAGGAQAQDAYNEDEVLFNYEQEFCKRFTLVVHVWGSDLITCGKHSNEPGLPHWWGGYSSGHDGDKRYLSRISFTAFGYFKGDPAVGEPEVMSLPDQGRTITREYPPEAVDVNEQITDTITLTESINEAYTEDTSFETTKGVSASVTAGFEAGTAGVKASGSVTVEGSIEVSQGKSFGHSEEQETTKEVTQSIETDVSVPADSQTILLTIQVGKSRTTYPVQENGYMDFSGCFSLYRWIPKTNHEWLHGSIAFDNSTYSADGPGYFCWNNVEHLLEILAGDRDREFPHMDGWLDHVCNDHSYWANGGACSAYHWLADPQYRHVNLQRQLTIDSEQAGKVEVSYEQ